MQEINNGETKLYNSVKKKEHVWYFPDDDSILIMDSLTHILFLNKKFQINIMQDLMIYTELPIPEYLGEL